MAILKARVAGAWVSDFVFKSRVNGAWQEYPLKARIGGTWVSLNAIVTVSGGSATHQSAGAGTYTAKIHFRSDGTVDRTQNTTVTQLSASTDWLIPNSQAPGDYEVFATKVSGPNPTSGPTLDAWHVLTSDRTWERVTSGNADTTVLDISVRKGSSGPAIDTGQYSLTAGEII